MKAIIFGANGQDGQYLYKVLQRSNIECLGVSRSGNWINGHVEDNLFVENLIKINRPEFIFHLAANSTTHHSAIIENHLTICQGTLNILESAIKHSPFSRIFLSGSGLQFRNINLPIHEMDPFEALSGYAACRIHTSYLARYYRSLGMKVYMGYFFNHESPRRPERHMSRKIAMAVRRISLGSEEKIEVGDGTVKKEWTYAGDVAEAIFILVNQEEIFESVIGSGEAHSIDEWVDCCFGLIGENASNHVVRKEIFTPEYKLLVSNPSTILSLGWKPTVSFQELASMLVNHIE